MNFKERILKFLKMDDYDVLNMDLDYDKQDDSSNTVTNYELNDKVDAFIKWYYDNDKFSYFGKANRMRDFIEKMAVWYELRYPDYEIERKMFDVEIISGKEISKIMFQDNEYINTLLDNSSKISEFDWSKFYSAKAFISSLPNSERIYFKPRFQKSFYLGENFYVRLSRKGTVLEIIDILGDLDLLIASDNIIGKNIKDVVKIFEDNGIEIKENSDVKRIIKLYDNWVYQKDEMLNCVMYRIIERGGNRIGPRRGFLFAKEFNRNIDIPMIYGIDTSDPMLGGFIMEYLKAGGNEDLICLYGYGFRDKQNEPLRTISLKEVMKLKGVSLELEKEKTAKKEVFQRLVDDLSSDDFRKTKVKQLRINRKLKKSRDRYKI